MSINIIFKEFAIENLSSIPHPTRNKVFLVLNDISSLSDLLFHFINFEVEESSLKRIKSNFENDFQKIYNLDKNELAGAIEGLATNYESFLKKIALIKFDSPIIWNGNGIYKGINKCLLFELIEGKASKVDKDLPGPEFTNFPSSIVNNFGTSKAILDFVRINLRNAVHSANPYTRSQLIQYSNLVLAAYLIAVNDNVEFLKKKFFPEFSYLESIINKKEFKNLNKNYIDLVGKEEIFVFDNIAIEQLDGQTLVESLNYIDQDEEINVVEDSDIARIDSVINISKDTNRFIVIGEPGSGKTTTLQKILFNNAIGLLNNVPNNKLPVYIKASSYASNKSFHALISQELNFASLKELVLKHQVLILIDGLNEIEDEFKISASKDLKELLSNENLHFIISSRKFGFFNTYNLNVYELKKLNESQIKQLIINILDLQKGEQLWNQITINKQLLDLASNPLLLMMIIKVSSLKNYEIPQNKGMLYKLFNDGILAREQKIYKTDINTKRDILSFIAFWMRKNGIFKNIKKVQVKQLIKEKLIEIDHSLGVNEILHELSDNNLLIEKNENFEFYHETQQEYYVALDIKNQFFKTNILEFDYNDNKWFEPILICSDLFTNDADRINFFESIFVGEKKMLPKPLNEFDSTDINPKFFIACKVAYNLQNIHPTLYKLAERYLANYIGMWHYRYKSNVLLTDFENIIMAVASLSNKNIFKHFFYNINNLECWFYNEAIDSRVNNPDVHNLFDEKFNRYIKAFMENLNDFPILFSVLKERKDDFISIQSLSRSISYNVNIFSRYLLKNSPLVQLIEAFKQHKDLDLLLEIGKNDLEFFIENYYSLQEVNDIFFYGFIANYHIRNVSGIDFLIKSIKDEKVETSIRFFILQKLIYKSEYLDVVLSTLNELLISKDVLIFYDELKKLLNVYSLEVLTTYGLNVIYTNPEIEKIEINLKFVKQLNNELIFEAHNNKLENRELLINMQNIYCDEKYANFSLYLNNSDFKKRARVVAITAPADLVEQCLDKYYLGGSLTLHYVDFKKQSRIGRYVFKELYKTQSSNQLYAEIDMITEFKIRRTFQKFKNCKLLIGYEFRFNIKSFTTHETSIYLKCNKNSFELNENLNTFKLIKINIDFNKPFNYHRDTIKSNESFIRYLKIQLNRANVTSFVKSIGLSHVFVNELSNLTYGVVVSTHAKVFTIYLIRENKLLNNIVFKSIIDEEININDIVLIEDNLNISKAVSKDIYQMFLVSEIAFCHQEYHEGFIRGHEGEKDYYFRFEHCNFIPYEGLKVKFLPGLNYSNKLNSSKPMAYCVQRIKKQNIVRVAEITTKNKYFLDLKCVDIHTQSIYFSRVYKSQEIINHSGIVKIGDVFSYLPHKIGENRISLQAKEL